MIPTAVDQVRDRRDRKAFVAFPYRLHAGDPQFVPPLRIDMMERLDARRHPFFRHGDVQCFLARKGGKVVGRVAALLDRASNAFHEERVVGFGFLEFDLDPEVARALLREVASWGASRGMKRIRGPLNYSTNEECGALVEGFDSPPVLMMPYNPPWYVEVLEGLGLEKAADLLAYLIDDTAPFDRLRRISARSMQRHGLTVRTVDLKAYERELEIIRNIYNSSWEKNWGFVPMDAEEFNWHAGKMKQVLEPELALIVEARGDPAGFSLSLPDYNQVLKHLKGRLFPLGIFKFLILRRRIQGIRTLAMGVMPACRALGVEGVLIQQTVDRGIALGHRWSELSWVLEDNEPMRKLAERMGAVAYKRYRIWEAPVERFSS